MKFSSNPGMGIKRDHFELIVLYSYFVFFLAAIFSLQGGNKSYYLSSSFSIVVVIFYLYTFCPMGTIKINSKVLFVTISLLMLIMSSPYSTFHLYPAIFYLYVISTIVFLENSSITKKNFINFLNRTYGLYLLLSLSQYLNIIPQLRENVNAFFINFEGVTVLTLYGLEGSTAYIDSYSGLIIIANIFLNRYEGKYKYIYIAIALIAMILTFRVTPIVGVLLTLIVYRLSKNRTVALFIILSIFTFWIMAIYFLLQNTQTVTIFSRNINISEILYELTHGRSMIWQIQLKYLFNNYNLNDFIFGNFNENFKLQLRSISGELISTTSNNAHNSYLANFYRAPMLTIFFYFLILGSIWKNFNKKTFAVIFFITTVAYTNATIFSIYNPVFLLCLIYLLQFKGKDSDFLFY